MEHGEAVIGTREDCQWDAARLQWRCGKTIIVTKRNNHQGLKSETGACTAPDKALTDKSLRAKAT